MDTYLWQLGTWFNGEDALECFYLVGCPSDEGTARLAAYRRVLVLYRLRAEAE
jgi:hypothetical protein